MNDNRLFSYKMTHDNGFAPNPFHGILTLANCKPFMRKSKKIGDWIAGFTSKKLNKDEPGKERLIYLMKVTEIETYYDYWTKSRYKSKIPKSSSSGVIDKAGDNIYMPLKNNPKYSKDYKQMDKRNHNEVDKDHDLKGENVLISNCFYYFGGSPLKIEDGIRPKVPKGPTSYGVRTYEAEKFIEFIQNNYQEGITNMPHNWPKKNSEYQNNIKKCK